MADLQGLIRLRKHLVDEKQRVLARLFREAEQIEAQKNMLFEQMERERKLAEESEVLESIAYYGRYAEGVRKKIAGLDRGLSKINQRISFAQEDMRQAFAELKKVEITQRRRDDAIREEERQKEEKELDEIGIEGFRRQNGNQD